MENLTFKTTINCQNCVRTVKGFLEDIKNIEQWEVDTGHPDKILHVKGEKLDVAAIIEAVEEAGFDIESIPA